jgi:putative DNA primase/helicase
MIVAPPSRHQLGLRYEWVPGYGLDECTLAPAPGWLLTLLDPPTSFAERSATPLGDDATIPEGERNTVLASLGGTMRRRGFTEGAILAALLTENAARCRPPLPEAEVAKIATSIARYPSATLRWRGLRVREARHA